jgi:hypothetical protein
VIAERHDRFLQPTFYRLLAVELASGESFTYTDRDCALTVGAESVPGVRYLEDG